MVELFPILNACLVSSALIVIENLLLWPYERLPSYLARYALGTGALGIGLLVWASQTDRLIAVVAFGSMAVWAMFVLGFLYWIRWWIKKKKGEIDQRAFWAGQIAGQPLSEEHDGPPSRSNPRSN